ncbi:aquaporin-11 isoform 2-T4 [Hipposideros larvatus]|uniref:Aquaporin-11 isoform X2 n=1 Tax=Hipposideros armiger TaxID=186990 RepID=A0A8B7QEH4_HIPAR|nr:PREDICTED: aquaporin-11 isoform X2 [Hipposideros armiger]
MTALLGLWPEVQDTCTSLGLMLSTVLFVALARVVLRQQMHKSVAHTFVLEFLATFQLCCCTHELQLLSEQEPAHPTWPLTLIYFFSLVHGLTLVGTSNNPCGVMMQLMQGEMSPETGAMRLLAQLIGALCSSAVLHFQEVRTQLRIHLLAALITFLVYAGGSQTGAVFNPALALSLHFKCFDEEFLQFFIVYWLAPSLGILLMILTFSFFLPWLYNNHTTNKKE